MFHDLELEDECAKIIDKFPGVVDRNLRDNRTPNKIQMGTKLLRKGQKSKFSTAASQSNCSSMHLLNPIRENGETMANRCQNWLMIVKMKSTVQGRVNNNNH